jgi:hypothetical protein
MRPSTESAVIAAVGHRSLKRTLDAATDWANPPPIVIGESECGQHTLAANRAHFAFDRVDLRQTIGAHRKPGDIQQREAANPAVRREQDGEKILGCPAGEKAGAVGNLA